MDPVTATYENILDTDEMHNFIGNFTCEVSNVRGEDQQTLFHSTIVIPYAYLTSINCYVVSAPSVTIIIPNDSFYIGLTNLTL